MRTLAQINVAAIERNVARLRTHLAPRTAFCAVVKADGYGHGAVEVARAALAGGATWLAVVTAGEAAALRRAGIDARLLVLGPLDDEDLPAALDAGGEVVVWDEQGLERLVRLGRPAAVHIKLDSGMGRLGQRDPEVALELCDRLARTVPLRLSGVMTHFATADVRTSGFFDQQLQRFTAFADRVRERHPQVIVHAANSAALLRDPAAHFDLVRAGVAVYGLDPFGRDPAAHGLEPALRWRSVLAAVKPLRPGESVGYGRRFVAERATTIGTVPVGYGDGLSRRAGSSGAAFLVDGRRVPLAGTVSMDSVGVDLGPQAGAAVGDPVTLIGRDGDEWLLAEELARRIGTINYEITCDIGPRVPRVYRRDDEPLAAGGA